MCQRGGGYLKGVDTRRCASKELGLKGVDLVGSYIIDWRKERVPVRTLGPEGGPHRLEGEQPFIRVWKPLHKRVYIRFQFIDLNLSSHTV